MRMLELKAYDGTLVRVPEDKAEQWKKGQEKIKELIAQGVEESEILKMIQSGKF